VPPAGAHLTLAGHTHGGQIALTGRNLNVARFSTRYIAGPYRRDEAFLYVSRGVGVGALPVRVGAPPEIDLLTLRSTAAGARVAHRGISNFEFSNRPPSGQF